jgi:hypothetical protein
VRISAYYASLIEILGLEDLLAELASLIGEDLDFPNTNSLVYD